MPKAMANRFGGTRGPGNLRAFGLWSFSTIKVTDVRPPKAAELSVFSGYMPKARLSRRACVALVLDRCG